MISKIKRWHKKQIKEKKWLTLCCLGIIVLVMLAGVIKSSNAGMDNSKLYQPVKTSQLNTMKQNVTDNKASEVMVLDRTSFLKIEGILYV